MQPLKISERWQLLFRLMGECEHLVHALWEFIVKRLTRSRDFYLLYDIKETCYAAGVKELDRIKQQVVTKPKKKEYLVKSLVKVQKNDQEIPACSQVMIFISVETMEFSKESQESDDTRKPLYTVCSRNLRVAP